MQIFVINISSLKTAVLLLIDCLSDTLLLHLQIIPFSVFFLLLHAQEILEVDVVQVEASQKDIEIRRRHHHQEVEGKLYSIDQVQSDAAKD